MTNYFKSIDGISDGGGDAGSGTHEAATVTGGKAPTAIVIGTGFGGLAAAIRLSVKGYRVQMLEKLDAPGGRAYVHKQDGFTFDAGPTIITLPHLIEELFTLCGKRMQDHVDLRLMAPFYRIRFDDGTLFNSSGDPERMRAEVARLSPGDVEGYERFMLASQEICKVGFEQLGHVPFGSVGDMARIAPIFICDIKISVG
jgi:phytoene desaturase